MSRYAAVQLLGSAADLASRARLQLLITHLVREHVLVPYATTFGELPRVHAQRGILYLVDHDRYQTVVQALAHGEMLPSLTKPGEHIPLPFRPIRRHCATCTCLRVPPPSPPAGTHATYAQLLFQIVADPDPPPDFECREDPDTGDFTYRVHVRGSIMYGNAHRDRDAARESAARAALVQLGVIDANVGVGPLPSVVHRPLSSPTDGATCGTETRMRPPPISIDGPGAVATHATGSLGGGYGWSAGSSPHAAALEPPTPIRDARDYPAWNAAKVTSPHPSSPKFAREATAGLETTKASSSPTGTTANDAAVHRTGLVTGATWRGSGHTSSSWGRVVGAPHDGSGSSWARIPGAGLVATHQTGPPPRAAWLRVTDAPAPPAVPTVDAMTMAQSRAASVAPPLSGPDSAGPGASSGWDWRAVVPHPTPPAPPTHHVPSHVTGPAVPYQTPARVAYHATTGPSVPRTTHPVATHATGPATFHTTAPPPPPPVLVSLATPAHINSEPTLPLPLADRTDFAPLIQFHHADIAGGNYISKLVEYLQKAKLPPGTAKYTFTTDGTPAGPTGPVQYGATLSIFGHRFSVPVQYRRKQDAKNQVARQAMEGLNIILD
ncbi:hypothetical protein GGF31_002966 [Allomyces arbusculus]|nr:hypothetical protein GGF31_002966 [Allomyces arbusculus]